MRAKFGRGPTVVSKGGGTDTQIMNLLQVGYVRYNTANNVSTFGGTVETLTNDPPHQRPSLSYDHISCDGQWFMFVYESLTSDHPYYTTTPM